MTFSAYFDRIVLVLPFALFGSLFPDLQAQAHYPAPSEPPSFDVLLRAEPIIVLARVGNLVGTSKKAFEAIPGDIDHAPAYSEEYHHYRLHTERLLKGVLPDTFDVRVLSGSRNHVLIDRAQGQEMLLVLAPDSGLDLQGRPRDTFLISHGTAYIVRNGRFQVTGARGSETWSVDRTADFVGQIERERNQQRAEAPEPRDAAVAVFSGEDQLGRPEPPAPEAPKLRKGEPLPADILAKAAPKAIESAGGEVRSDRIPPTRIHMREIQLDRSLEFRPRRVPSGNIESNACLRGSYSHSYETSGIAGREVWLCCIPVDEVLRDTFQCSGGTLPRPFGSPDYIKIRYCSLLHPTESEPTYVPICIPAPLQAPELDTKR
ncbi:hypothetical protein KBI52_07435 [Microvirga sp. HBU67558]|uniref:hypothetical protein n=1 Tax=Microvirga TaxID=186650 RepID=UPI001B38798A|nr:MULTISPECIES: hypothetical protein [unclassified Microvirga]MBQ0820046.1 hypothetical protein [Microvirga sp. HBU67558]